MTYSALQAMAERRLRSESQSESPALDARLLVQKAANLDDTHLAIRRMEEAPPEVELALGPLLEARIHSRPMAYILGHKEFYDLDFAVDERVLIPQPDTETIVEDVLKTTEADTKLSLLDLCTGSGCLGITLARHLGCHATLSDVSEDALQVAEMNAERWLEKGQYTLIQSDLFSHIDGRYDLIVTNPPYLCSSWIQEASEEVRKEPLLALDGGGLDGLSLIRNLVVQARDHLAPKGRIWIECDWRQTSTVQGLLLANGCTTVYIEKDLSGRDRVVVGATDHVRAAD